MMKCIHKLGVVVIKALRATEVAPNVQDAQELDALAPKIKLGNTRVTGKEQFYTPTSTADSIFTTLNELVPDMTSRTLLEPAGGTGSIIDAALGRGFTNVLSFDIEPHHDLVQRGNFLEQTITQHNLVTVSNPPFGRNNSLAIPFFNHAAQVSDYIVFIVPRSWRKWSVQNKLDRNFHLVQDGDLAVNYVDRDGNEVHGRDRLRTCIQYWKREDFLRPMISVQDMGLIEKCQPEEADAALTIFGYGCGTITTDFPRVKNTTSMFLKLKNPRVLAAAKKANFAQYFMNTAYTEALSWPEINAALNEQLFGNPRIIETL